VKEVVRLLGLDGNEKLTKAGLLMGICMLANSTAHPSGASFMIHDGYDGSSSVGGGGDGVGGGVTAAAAGPFGEQQAVLAVGMRELSSPHKEVTQMAAALLSNVALALRLRGGASVANLADVVVQLLCAAVEGLDEVTDPTTLHRRVLCIGHLLLLYLQNKESVGPIVNPAELIRDLGFAEVDGPLQQAWGKQHRDSPGSDAQRALEEVLAIAAD
jgi:hypothetical protein